MKFEDSLQKLEQLVARMEGGGLALDDMIKDYEAGQKLVKECQEELKAVQERIEKVTKAGMVEELVA